MPAVYYWIAAADSGGCFLLLPYCLPTASQLWAGWSGFEVGAWAGESLGVGTKVPQASYGASRGHGGGKREGMECQQ